MEKEGVIDLWGHLIHQTASSSSKIFDHRGYSILFSSWSHRMKLLFFGMKEVNDDRCQERMRLRQKLSLLSFTSSSFIDIMNSLDTFKPRRCFWFISPLHWQIILYGNHVGSKYLWLPFKTGPQWHHWELFIILCNRKKNRSPTVWPQNDMHITISCHPLHRVWALSQTYRW